MELHTCTIALKDKRVLVYQTVEQTLGALEHQTEDDIQSIDIEALDGQQILSYQGMSVEESLESLMSL